MNVSTQKTIRSQGAYVIKAAESRPPRQRSTTTRAANRTAEPNTADRRAARALRQQKQQ
jgi:hypothetical protein